MHGELNRLDQGDPAQDSENVPCVQFAQWRHVAYGRAPRVNRTRARNVRQVLLSDHFAIIAFATDAP